MGWKMKNGDKTWIYGKWPLCYRDLITVASRMSYLKDDCEHGLYLPQVVGSWLFSTVMRTWTRRVCHIGPKMGRGCRHTGRRLRLSLTLRMVDMDTTHTRRPSRMPWILSCVAPLYSRYAEILHFIVFPSWTRDTILTWFLHTVSYQYHRYPVNPICS